MIINDPKVVAEVRAAFDRYEQALLDGDAATLDALFVPSELTIRYGVHENLYGIEQIRVYRAKQGGFDRTLDRLVITTYGRDTATAATLFRRPNAPGMVGRQMQTWIRQDGNWRVAAAHVSMMPDT